MTKTNVIPNKVFALEQKNKKNDKRTEHQKLPKPSGWRLLVMDMGDLCYKDQEKFPTGPWCKKKDWVLFGRYAGARIKIDGGELRLLNDDEIMAVIEDPEDVMSPLTQ